jgi:hypothetical protein
MKGELPVADRYFSDENTNKYCRCIMTVNCCFYFVFLSNTGDGSYRELNAKPERREELGFWD